uniref:Lfe206p2 n=1 Tax=Leptospirillum ferrooxidans TaxID=180 RepID=Q7X186_9BACT|nr:Lfe206p2 [Leptospirillum ferrooxidans]
MTDILKRIREPKDIKKLTMEEMGDLAQEIRLEMIQVISKIGGHFGGGLGVVELTIALHRVFDTDSGQGLSGMSDTRPTPTRC